MSIAFHASGALAPWRSEHRPYIGSVKPDLASANRRQVDAYSVGFAAAPALITVLMCTRNGATHIEEQLQSLAKQTHSNWRVVASDDGSTDNTIEKFSKFALQHGDRAELRHGPRTRSACGEMVEPRQFATKNFLSLATDGTIAGDYFAYCDQDDIWMADKLERAVSSLSVVPNHVPALYCSRTRYIRENGEPCGLSPFFSKTPSFRNALVQSLSGGNTMVFNRAARDLLAAAGNVDVVAHDWWTYLLVSGGGGIVRYDRQPSLNYRQHRQNLVGSNQGLKATVRRMRAVARGGWAEWTDLNLKALKRSAHLLAPRSRYLLEEVSERRGSASLLTRLSMLTRLRLYRQTLRGQLSLGVAVFANRL